MSKYKLKSDGAVINNTQVTLTSFIDGNSDNIGKRDKNNTNKRTFPILSNNNNQDKQEKPIKPTVKRWFTEKAHKSCTKKLLKKRLPILKWLPSYNVDFAVSDLVAGVTVGLTVIPQGIAYTNVAGLPPQIGLYSSFMACFVYTIFGSSKDSAIGPTAIAAFLTRENNHGFGVDGAVLLCFLSGCVELVMGLLQLGFLIDFISGPVSMGFTSAAAIIIATTQMKHILGLNFDGGKFFHTWALIFQHISEARLWDAILGITSMVIILFLRKLKDFNGNEDRKDGRILGKLVWFLCTSRNIIVVVCSGLMGYVFEKQGMQPFTLTGHVKPGLPTFSPPPFATTINNQTITFTQMSTTLGSAILVVPLLSILENIALAKVFSEGKTIDATQEMIALGLCNIASSFVSSMPVSGALSRGAVNNASGVKTTFGGVYTGLIVLVSLYMFTPYFRFIPKASLAAVIIAAVVFMVELHVIKPIWRTKKSDLIPALATFVSCLFLRLELGIVVGIAINVIFLLYGSARPYVSVEKMISTSGYEYVLITPDRSLTFPSVEYVRSVIWKAAMKENLTTIPVVIDAKHIQIADFTTANVIKSLIEDFSKRGQPIIFFNLKSTIVTIFQGVEPSEFIYCRTFAELNELLKEFQNKQFKLSEACEIRTNTTEN